MLFLRTSADGCLTDDCPEVIDIRGTPVSDLETEWSASAVQIYPNPVGGKYVQIDLEEPGHARAMIYDLSGRLALSALLESGSNEISLEDLAAGVYVVQVALDHGRLYTQKLVRW